MIPMNNEKDCFFRILKQAFELVGLYCDFDGKKRVEIPNRNTKKCAKKLFIKNNHSGLWQDKAASQRE